MAAASFKTTRRLGVGASAGSNTAELFLVFGKWLLGVHGVIEANRFPEIVPVRVPVAKCVGISFAGVAARLV